MNLRRGLIVFISLSITVGAIVLYLTTDKQTIKALVHANKAGLLVALGFVAMAWVCDATRFRLVAKAMGYPIPFFRSLTTTWLHYFGCAITPMQVGGGPFQVYVLYKNANMPIGTGVALTTIRTLLSTFILSVAAPIALLFRPQLFEGHRFLMGVFVYVALMSIVAWLAFILSVIKPQFIKKIAINLILWLKRFKFFDKLPAIRVCKRVNLEIDQYSSNVRRMINEGLGSFLLAILFSICHLLMLFSVLPCLIWSVGYPVHYVDALLAQAVFTFLLYFIPTPGGSGVAEGGGAAFFTLLVPGYMAGVMAVAWRFFTEYISIFLGAIVAIKTIGWKNAENIFASTTQDPNQNEKERENCNG